LNYTRDQVLNMLRTGGTLRYHTHWERSIKPQTTGTHSYNGLLLGLALTRGLMSREAMLAWMLHDAGEHWAGDIPAPSKRSFGPMFHAEFEAREQALLLKATGLLAPPLSEFETRLLRVVDGLEGALHCVRERQMGNTLMGEVLETFFTYFTTEAARLRHAAAFDYRLYSEVESYIKEFLT
jgi:5'-deoxynucleotidase YfbR-like HD superfamily hydrolase